MAGRPKRRAQLEQQSLSTPIPDALSTPEPMRAPAPARARMREAPTPIRRGGYLGASSRAAADSAAATELNGLAQALRPGAQVRIERVRPSWAAGWIEDLTLDVGGLGELYEHLQEEWGGKTYRCTVLLPNGAPAFETRIEIAGPPLHEGSEVDRDEWNGAPGKRERERERERNAIPYASSSPAPAAAGAMDTLALVKMMLEMQREASDRSMAAVRELTTTSAAQNQGLIQAIVEARSAPAGPSLVQQLGDLEQTKRAIDRMGRVFGAADRPPADDPDDMVTGAVKEAARHFIGGVIASEFGGKLPGSAAPAAQPPRPPSGPRVVPVQRLQNVRPPHAPANSAEIPNALQGGQNRRTS